MPAKMRERSFEVVYEVSELPLTILGVSWFRRDPSKPEGGEWVLDSKPHSKGGGVFGWPDTRAGQLAAIEHADRVATKRNVKARVVRYRGSLQS